MRIKLYTFLDEANEAYLNMPIILKSPRSGFLRVKAIIDTGSPKTVLGHPEAMALQIPITSITSQNIIRLGGNKYWSGVFDRLKIMMKSEDGKLISEEIAVNVLKPTSGKETPSGFSLLIGMDFLRKTGYRLFCDMKNDIAYLEK